LLDPIGVNPKRSGNAEKTCGVRAENVTMQIARPLIEKIDSRS
jgi:hypothetical protein